MQLSENWRTLGYFGGLSLLGLLALGSWTRQDEMRQHIAQTDQQVAQDLNTLSRSLDQSLSHSQTALRVLSADPALVALASEGAPVDSQAPFISRFRHYQRDFPLIDQLQVFDHSWTNQLTLQNGQLSAPQQQAAPEGLNTLQEGEVLVVPWQGPHPFPPHSIRLITPLLSHSGHFLSLRINGDALTQSIRQSDALSPSFLVTSNDEVRSLSLQVPGVPLITPSKDALKSAFSESRSHKNGGQFSQNDLHYHYQISRPFSPHTPAPEWVLLSITPEAIRQGVWAESPWSGLGAWLLLFTLLIAFTWVFEQVDGLRRLASDTHAPLRFWLGALISIFIAEAVVMAILAVVPPLSRGVEAFVDASMLAIVCAPILYLLLKLPLGRILREQKQALVEIQRSRSRFRQVLVELPEAVLVVQDQRITLINNAAAELIGSSNSAQHAKQKIFSLFSPASHDALKTGLRTILSCDTLEIGKLQLLTRFGAEVPVAAKLVTVHINQEPAALMVLRDLREEQKMLTRMMQMDRIIAVGTLAAGVGHELNNPLTYVLGNIHYLKDRVNDLNESITVIQSEAPANSRVWTLSEEVEEFSEILNEVAEGGERIRGIVRDLKSFSRDRKEQDEVLKANDIVNGALQMVRNQIQAHATLMLEKTSIASVRGNIQRLEQVIVNLLINAMHAVNDASVKNPTVSVRVFDQENRVIIEIGDNGVGIHPAHLRRIFEPFFTTKESRDGTGLGLAICQEIVSSYDGEITVQSTLGDGSRFRVSLPTVRGHRQAPVGSASMPPPEAHSGKSILVIDDEPSVGRALSRMLSAHYHVHTVESAQDALRQLEQGAVFDVLISDIMMPKVNGMKFYQQLKERNDPHAHRIIFISGGSTNQEIQTFSAAHLVLEKPFDVAHLHDAIQSVLNQTRTEE